MTARLTIALACLTLPTAARAQSTSDLMPTPPAAAPGQTGPTYPGAPPAPPVVTRGTLSKAGEPLGDAKPAGRTGYDIYEPTSMMGNDNPGRVESDRVPETHVVRKGDTLWEIAAYYFRNPWTWPKLWSYNPSITNPHWIYPGDLVRLMPASEAPAAPPSAIAPERPRAPTRTEGVFLRQTGFIEPDELKSAGTIIGSREEKIMLGSLDEAYVEMNKAKPLKVGERYTIYRPLNDVKHPVSRKKLGTLVQILGEAEVKTVTDGNIARCVIVDSTDPIERGFKVGPLRRQFKIVEPVRSSREIEGVVVTTLRPINMVHAETLIFIDRGKGDGVGVGNRLFVTRRGDGYLPLLARGPIDDRRFPREIVAEVLIIDVRDGLSTALVLRTSREVRIGDRVETRKGF